MALKQPEYNVGEELETNEESVEFNDVFDLEEIQKIQNSFSSATGVASIITDTEGRPITEPSNFCRLCIDIIRGTEKGMTNCMKSDAELGRPNPDGPIIQQCLSGGLWDGGTSIYFGDKHIANWLIGQIRTPDFDDEALMAYAEEIGADEDEFRDAMGDVTQMSREQFEQVGQTLFLFAKNLSEFAYQKYRQERESIARRKAEEEREQLQREMIEAQQQAIEELSTPVIPVMDNIIVMPLVGNIDSLRAREITRTLLAGIGEHHAKIVILDVTGVTLMDTGIVSHLNKTIQAAQLKGAKTIVSGVNDAVAETIVDLGIDWSRITTLRDLQTALRFALNSLGVKLTM